jgi:predicted nucleic acid-binding Zn ribbon protein
MSRRAPRPLGAALEGFVARLAPATTLAAVQGVWAAVVGAGIAASATPIAERDGVLRVLCAEAVWAHELELMGPDLVEQINAALGRQAIRSLRCTATPPR